MDNVNPYTIDTYLDNVNHYTINSYQYDGDLLCDHDVEDYVQDHERKKTRLDFVGIKRTGTVTVYKCKICGESTEKAIFEEWGYPNTKSPAQLWKYLGALLGKEIYTPPA